MNGAEEEAKIKHIIMAIILADDQLLLRSGGTRFKALVRVPLILMTFTAGLLGGFQTSAMKGMTTSFSIEGLFAVSTICYGAIALPLVMLQLKSLNVVMENYEQLNATPIYESSLIMMNITCGIIILHESQLYEWHQLLLLILCASIIISGVYIIVNKPNHLFCLKLEEEAEKEPEFSASNDLIDSPLTENSEFCSEKLPNCICTDHLSELSSRLNLKKIDVDQRQKVMQCVKVIGLVASTHHHS